ncbi:MAG: class I SAM-dependent methyltransferase [Alphaproteobacteria bacterium]|nr:class I SAM-dependent methyltransferase [Alphaproteobacteria bacterium]
MSCEPLPLPPSSWVERFCVPARAGERALDVAAGGGRHTILLRRRGYRVVALDRDDGALRRAFATDPEVRIVRADLEGTEPWPLPGEQFSLIVVTNYLHRPLFPALLAALAEGGLLVYETFARGHEVIGRPRRPEFLLNEGELLDLCRSLSVVAYEHGLVRGGQALVQRICARRTDGASAPFPLDGRTPTP